MSHHRASRAAALLLVLALVAAACSGSKTESDEVSSGDRQIAPGEGNQPTEGDGSEAEPGETTAPTDASGAPAPNLGDGGSAQGTGGAGTGGQPGDGGSATGGGGGTAGPSFTDADLYSGAANTQGISDTEIRLCAHAALVFASAFDTRPEDLNVYWEMVRDGGGIHGRNVSATYEDDAYNPSQAVAAAERCAAKNPFLLLGGIGFDQIPAVRNWAEQNKMLYFHHIAVEAGLEGKRYSFTGLPSVEQTGTVFGEYLVNKHRSERIGIVWRRSENWEPGHRAGVQVLRDNRANVVADMPVTQNQAVYSQQLLELIREDAEVVWVWENALAAAELIQQAKNQGYSPTWVVFPFQTTLDVTGEVDIEGIAAWPAYARGGYPGDPFAEHGYNAEIKRFEAAMAKYRPGVRPNDILWQVWIANKAIHDLFERCGRDCTRNRLAGMFLSGLKSHIEPNCPVDYTRRDSFGGHKGGYLFMTHAGTAHPSGFVFQTTQWCTERFL
jgi:ABC-type branched-subunit amino acid transport system substrate-binding protein